MKCSLHLMQILALLKKQQKPNSNHHRNIMVSIKMAIMNHSAFSSKTSTKFLFVVCFGHFPQQDLTSHQQTPSHTSIHHYSSIKNQYNSLQPLIHYIFYCVLVRVLLFFSAGFIYSVNNNSIFHGCNYGNRLLLANDCIYCSCDFCNCTKLIVL